ncbi:sugar nucleotide-binding protein [Actinoplanes sp. NPDC051633]|uniref:SDR family oxidoreductase n=1 Tax=Actinoplanes sp. NPDC051633 TaxID=3155670 RepID=UPI003447C0D4
MTSLLVVGASGYLGGEVARLAVAGGWEVTGTSSADLDITSAAAVRSYVDALRPDVVVNAAYRVSDWAVTADGAANVAVAARGLRLVHVSSDALHAGRPEPYGDAEPPTPIYPYGAAKAAAETAVRAVNPGAAVVRTSLIVGDERSHQVRLCLDLATGRRPGALHTDEFRCPIGVTDLAAAVLELAGSDWAGPINVAGPQRMSRAELGALVAASHGLDPASVPTRTIAESGIGPRPANVVLDSTRAAAMLSTELRRAAEVV